MVEPGHYPDPDEPQHLTPDAVHDAAAEYGEAPIADPSSTFVAPDFEAVDVASEVVAEGEVGPEAEGDAEAAADNAPRAPGAAARAMAVAGTVASTAWRGTSTAAAHAGRLAWAYPRATAASALSALVLFGVFSLKSGKSPTMELPPPGPLANAAKNDEKSKTGSKAGKVPKAAPADTSGDGDAADPAPAPAPTTVAEAPAPAPVPGPSDPVQRASMPDDLGLPDLPSMVDQKAEAPAPDAPDEAPAPAPAPASSLLLASASFTPGDDLPAPTPAVEPEEAPAPAPAPVAEEVEAPAPAPEPAKAVASPAPAPSPVDAPSAAPAPLPAPASPGADDSGLPDLGEAKADPGPAPGVEPAAGPAPELPPTEPEPADDLPPPTASPAPAPAAETQSNSNPSPAASALGGMLGGLGLPASNPTPTPDAQPASPADLPEPVASPPAAPPGLPPMPLPAATLPPAEVPPLRSVPEPSPSPVAMPSAGIAQETRPPVAATPRASDPQDGEWVPIRHSPGVVKLDSEEYGPAGDRLEGRSEGQLAEELAGRRESLPAEEPVRFVSEAGGAAPEAAAGAAAVAAAERPDAGRMETVLHKVQPGENFWTISRTHYASGRYYRALGKANADQFQRLQDLYVGAVIRIPPPEDLDPAFIDPPGGRSARDRDPDAPAASPVKTALPAGVRPVRRSARFDGELNLPVSDPSTERASDRRRSSPRGASDEPAPAASRRAESGPVHKVRSRETLRSIARDRLGDSRRAEEIYELNRDVIDDPARLAAGQELLLPDDAE